MVDADQSYSLIPSKDQEIHKENLKAYLLIKQNAIFLHKNVRQMSKNHYQGNWVDLMSSILSAI